MALTWRSRRGRRRHLDAALVGNDIVCNGVTVALDDPLPVSLDGTRKKGRDEKVNPNRVAFTQMDNMIQFVFGAIVEQDFCYFFFFFFLSVQPHLKWRCGGWWFTKCVLTSALLSIHTVMGILLSVPFLPCPKMPPAGTTAMASGATSASAAKLLPRVPISFWVEPQQ